MTWTTNIQWKGTDLCMDFICPKCDYQSHFDGMFAYAVECPECKTRWRMPSDVPVVECTDPNEMVLTAEEITRQR